MTSATRKLMRLCAWFGLGLCVMVVVLWSASTGNRVRFDERQWGGYVPPHHKLSLADHSLYFFKGEPTPVWRILKRSDKIEYIDRFPVQWQFWGSARTETDDFDGSQSTAIQIPLWMILCVVAFSTGWLWWRSRSNGPRGVHMPMLPSRRSKVSFASCCLVFLMWTGSFFCETSYCVWQSGRNAAGVVNELDLMVSSQNIRMNWKELSNWPSSRESRVEFVSVCDVTLGLPETNRFFLDLGAGFFVIQGIDLPLWFLTVLSAMLTMFFCWRDRFKTWTFCCKCRYDLRGNTSGVCPECGEEVPEALVAWLKTGDAW